MEEKSNKTVNQTYNVYFDGVCGANSHPFFNQSETWNTLVPDVSLCFRETILIWLPCAYFWLCFPIRMRQIFLRNGYGVQEKISPLNICKTVILCFLSLIAIIDLAFSVQGIGNVQNDITIAGVTDPVIRLLTFSAIIGLLQFERKNGFITSWIQFLSFGYCF